ncbi:MAG: ABC transporter ATP-binding protein [Acidimicrobiia bacterium]
MFLLHRVTAGYGDTTVLRDVSLRVPSGATVALLGPNGAGKTTLLRVASGLLRPWAGRVQIDGEDMTAAEPYQLVDRGVCHVPEGRGIFPSLTVRENLLLQVKAGEASSVDRAVDAFPILGERMAQTARTLSGGQQQMLALARAYLANPRVVLLDEVSMGLAPKIVDEIFEFLERLSSQGAALLLVEQYVTRALGIADYVYMLNKGTVTFCGEPGELNHDDVFASYLSHAV